MATKEPRINIALDKDTLALLKGIALTTQKSVSAICADFIRRQIEWDEDAYDIQCIQRMEKADLESAIPAADVRKMLDALPD